MLFWNKWWLKTVGWHHVWPGKHNSPIWMKENDHKQDQMSLWHGDSKRMEGPEQVCVGPLSRRLAQIPQGHLKCREERWKLFPDSSLTLRFYFFLIDVHILSSPWWKGYRWRFLLLRGLCSIVSPPPLPSCFSTLLHTHILNACWPSLPWTGAQARSLRGITEVLVSFPLPCTYVLPSAGRILTWL